jgi:hypothetical protein
MGSNENSADRPLDESSDRPDRSARPRTDPAMDPAETRAAAHEATRHAASVASPERLVAGRRPPEPYYRFCCVERDAVSG